MSTNPVPLPELRNREEEQDDQALGHTVRVFFGTVFRGRQGVIILTLLLGGGAMETWRMVQRTMSPASSEVEVKGRIERKLDAVGADVLETKITVKAMLDTMPVAQRLRADQLIKDRLEILKMARSSAERNEP